MICSASHSRRKSFTITTPFIGRPSQFLRIPINKTIAEYLLRVIFESIDYTTMCTFPSSNRVRMPSAHNFHYLRITGGILHIFSCFIFILSFIFASLLRHMMQTPLQYSNAFKCNPPQRKHEMRNRVSKKKKLSLSGTLCVESFLVFSLSKFYFI